MLYEVITPEGAVGNGRMAGGIGYATGPKQGIPVFVAEFDQQGVKAMPIGGPVQVGTQALPFRVVQGRGRHHPGLGTDCGAQRQEIRQPVVELVFGVSRAIAYRLMALGRGQPIGQGVTQLALPVA